MPVITANWYDYPQLYDLAFRDETRREAVFLTAVGGKYCSFPVRRLLEPGCGSGRLVRAMAARGFDVAGFDLCQPALDYARRLWNRTLTRKRSNGSRPSPPPAQVRLWPDNMVGFRIPAKVPQPFDAAYCTLNTFRHLLTEEDARRHLQGIADVLRPGGIYVLGFHLLPPDADEESEERWQARQGKTKLNATLRVMASSRRRRIERLRVSLRAQSPSGEVRLRSEFPLRLYTARQFRRLLASVPSFELADVFDFWYDIEEPLQLDDRISDCVFILRKRKA